MDLWSRRQLIEALIPVIRRAGETVRRLQEDGTFVTVKQDGSPVTLADLASHDILRTGCQILSSAIPVISEEDKLTAAVPHMAALVIDPLDGTKEFIQGRKEFAINIALLEEGHATAGLIYAPAEERLFFSYGVGLVFEETYGARRGLAGLVPAARRPIVLASRSHLDCQTEGLLARLQPCTVRKCGSSLKFAAIAAAEADVYPRLSPTMIWDCAAGQAIIEAAGGVVLRADGSPLSYQQNPTSKVSGFVAARTPQLAAQVIAAIRQLDTYRMPQ
ncbi:3'(2'),5'-bisphosphate nucleotidase CysQ family protein [Rhizobium leucaenae]|uniref:3'(2'),5'-bisphosphate nucleotidase CysQ family protein n=1 Tax=Rhizobium leucaenae TaxID=29450 RepID=UPI0007EE7AC9|nr:3'(2'),5'-bisphosphate nucleotidase CysQ [Rhizobium leucaenae]MBB6303740.1 3'(2'), 5'-bisphosphate nucleotidase [Rhizobium leucaenae]